jgi:hypothetical protein
LELGCISAVDSRGETIFIADAHRGDEKSFIVSADEKLAAFPPTALRSRPSASPKVQIALFAVERALPQNSQAEHVADRKSDGLTSRKTVAAVPSRHRKQTETT